MFQIEVVEKVKTHISCSITFFPVNLAVLWDNVDKDGRARQATDDSIIWCMPVACWITKATDIYSEYVILIAFPRQLWLRERNGLLLYTYIARLVYPTSRPVVGDLLRPFRFALSWVALVEVRCFAVSIRVLLDILKEGAGDRFHRLEDTRHIPQ
jgi:hypothetical protein